jgi:hypothetical protein
MKVQLFSLVVTIALRCTAAQVSSDGGSVQKSLLNFPNFGQQMNQFAPQNTSGSDTEEETHLRSNALMK